MKTWIILAFSMVISVLMLACGGPEKNKSADQIPAAMACPASQDPSQGCPTPSDAAIPLGDRPQAPPDTTKSEAAARMKSKTKSIEGRCEFLVRGEKKPRTCADIKVMVRSLEKGEMRDGVVDGFAVSFADLNEESYKVLAQSETFEVITTDREYKPGQRVNLKIKGRPRAH